MSFPPAPSSTPSWTLRGVALDYACRNYGVLRSQLRDNLPSTLYCDVLYHLAKYHQTAIDMLREDLSCLHTFLKLLRTKEKRRETLFLFRVVMEDKTLINCPQGSFLPETFTDQFMKDFTDDSLARYINCHPPDIQTAWVMEVFQNGILLGDFLRTTGWFFYSHWVLDTTVEVTGFVMEPSTTVKKAKLVCYQRLLLCESLCGMIQEARTTYNKLLPLLNEDESSRNKDKLDPQYAILYNTLSVYHFNENKYVEALSWSLKGLHEIQKGVQEGRLANALDPEFSTISIDVLRQAASCCAVRREHAKAKILISKALSLTTAIFGKDCVKYGDVLMDYGYFNVCSDDVRRGVNAYMSAYALKDSLFGRSNVITAISMAELAYGIYVKEYNTGTFDLARGLSETAIAVLERAGTENQLLVASAKRVLALLLEEIAIDAGVAGVAGGINEVAEQCLKQAEELHLFCLTVAQRKFGDTNVQTAKHYGNLGRLYQTMRRHEDAEEMHLKAIAIKESILGESDYEVALSVGHLASLYNYDLHQYDKAENLHLRSISVGRALFGDAYSGLEYEYRGLIQIYTVLGNREKFSEYSDKLMSWKALQDLRKNERTEEDDEEKTSPTLNTVIQTFLNMDSNDPLR